jgi:hypothetical protein
MLMGDVTLTAGGVARLGSAVRCCTTAPQRTLMLQLLLLNNKTGVGSLHISVLLLITKSLRISRSVAFQMKLNQYHGPVTVRLTVAQNKILHQKKAAQMNKNNLRSQI